MTPILFQPIGPLLPDSPLYIERQAEQQAVQALRSANPDFLLISEPRQQGKTSFINHLSCHPSLDHCWFVIVNAGRVRKNLDEADWYALLHEEVRRQLGPHGVLHEALPPCKTQEQWRDRLLAVGAIARERRRLVVIAIDEVGRLPTAWRESFLSSLCEVRDSRANTPAFIAITFLFVGSFRPEAMITDGNVSPFNKAKSLALEDFNAAQIGALLQQAGVAEDLAGALVPRLLYWTDGQPYLVQRLCEILFGMASEQVTPDTIDRAVLLLERSDQVHLSPMFEKLRAAKRICRKGEKILNGEEVAYAPASIKWQAELASIGLIKAQQSTGLCVIRNSIYARAFRRFLLDQREGAPQNEPEADCVHLIELWHTKKTRYEQIELDAARFGPHVAPHLPIELRELKKELAILDEQLRVLGCRE